MKLRLSDDQQMLKDSVDAYCRTYAMTRAASLAHETGCRGEVWMALAGQGWLGAGFAEDIGGFGLGAVAEMLALEGAGAALMTEPLLAGLHGARIASMAPAWPGRDALLAAAFAGEDRIILAHDEPAMRGRPGPIATVATASGSGYRLTGRKALIAGAPTADWLIVSTRCGDRTLLFLERAEPFRPRMKACRTIDGASAAEILLDGLDLSLGSLIAEGEVADRILSRARDYAIVGGCADAVGAMDAALAITRDYLGMRQQFGQAIGTFQALQHRYADMVIAVEQARSILLYAIAALDSDDEAVRARGVTAAKVRGIESARFVGAHAVQLHGGIGVTEEHLVSHYFRRLTAHAQSFGGLDHHLELYAAAPKETVLWT